jgi:hypothetical protein
MDNILDSVESNRTVSDSNIEDQYIINEKKFIILSVLTFGLYELWWIYKSWRFFKQKDMPEIQPAARALFSIFFLTSLFNRILQYAKENNYTESYNSFSLFIFFFLANLLSRLPEPYWLLSTFSFVFLLPSFKAFNYARKNSTEYNVIEQDNFNARQIVLMLFGLIFWILVIMALLDYQ